MNFHDRKANTRARRTVGALVLSLACLAFSVQADESDLNDAVGSIKDAVSNKNLGTGFIVFNTMGHAYVITAYHVIQSKKAKLRLPGSSGDLTLSRVATVAEEDLVSFSIDVPQGVLKPVFKWSKKKPSTLDLIAYWGVDFARNRVFGQRTKVDSSGKGVLDDGSLINFVDFPGDTAPGFSGSPVFSRDTREVFGVLISGLFQCSIDGQRKLMMNRAVIPSKETLEILLGEGKSTSPIRKYP